jgi:hypothetical protein
VLQKHFEEAGRMAGAASAQLQSIGWTDAFATGHGEVVVAWEEDGLWFRTMIDWLAADGLAAYDLKTSAASFAPHLIGRKAVDDGWDIQVAMHERALGVLDPANAGRRKFRFAALENYPPYALVPVEMTEAWLTIGRKKLDFAIARWRECLTAGRWPAYGTDIVRPEYPGYAETQWLNREVEFDERQRTGPRIPDNVLMAG